MEASVPQTVESRLLQLKKVVLGDRNGDNNKISSNPTLRLGYDCVLDLLVAVYRECDRASSLKKDKNIARFLKKCNI